jgi:hypothetical protein
LRSLAPAHGFPPGGLPGGHAPPSVACHARGPASCYWPPPSSQGLQPVSRGPAGMRSGSDPTPKGIDRARRRGAR